MAYLIPGRMEDWITDEERFRIKEISLMLRDRYLYKKEIYSYVYGDVEIPVEFMNDDTDVRMKYLQSC